MLMRNPPECGQAATVKIKEDEVDLVGGRLRGQPEHPGSKERGLSRLRTAPRAQELRAIIRQMHADWVKSVKIEAELNEQVTSANRAARRGDRAQLCHADQVQQSPAPTRARPLPCIVHCPAGRGAGRAR